MKDLLCLRAAAISRPWRATGGTLPPQNLAALNNIFNERKLPVGIAQAGAQLPRLFREVAASCFSYSAISSSEYEYESREANIGVVRLASRFFFAARQTRIYLPQRRRNRVHFHQRSPLFPESRAGGTAAPHTAAALFPVCRQTGFPPFPA
jgi:hypothetical protein